MNTETSVRLRTGRSMPPIGLGTWQLNDDTAGTIEWALQLGYRMIDTSGDYGTQPGIGEGMRRSGVDRGDIYLVTKVEEDEDAYEATRRNLEELGTEYADLMLLHRPPPSGPGVELWEGLIRARDEGLAVDIGVSNYTVEQIEALTRATGEIPVVNQNEWSPFGFSGEMLEYCQRQGIVIQAYSPLTRGQRLNNERLREVASAHGKTPAQVLIRWNLALGTVPLPKANLRDHLAENLEAVEIELSDWDIDVLNSLNERYSSLGALPYA